MDFFDVINKRKAVRKYTPDKKIPENDINKILNTANLAPSAKHLQSYKIFVAKSKKAREGIFHSCYNQKSDFVRNASVILIFCKDSKDAQVQFGERGKLYSLQDATIAASYSMLAATALGYGSCWVGNFNEEEVKKVLNTSLIPIAVIVIGFSNENPERPLRKSIETLAEII